MDISLKVSTFLTRIDDKRDSLPVSILSYSYLRLLCSHPLLCLALALSTISSSKAAFICSLTVIVVPLVSFLLYKKPLTASNAISAIIALCGVAVLEGMVNANQLFGVMPSIATDAIHVAVQGSNALPELTAMSNAAGLVAAPIDASSEALSAITNRNSIESFLSIHKGDLLALGQPIGFGFAFMKIEQYVEKFKDVKNQVLTISAAQCVAVGLLSFIWVLFDYRGHIPNFGYLVSYPLVLPLAVDVAKSLLPKILYI